MARSNSIRRANSSLLHIDICARGGAEDVRVEGVDVIGRWNTPLKLIAMDRPGSPLEDFINQPDTFADLDAVHQNTIKRLEAPGNLPLGWRPQPSIVHFTKRYGPIVGKPDPGKHFRFGIHEFATRVMLLRSYWETLGRLRTPEHWGQQEVAGSESNHARALKKHFAERKRGWEDFFKDGEHPLWVAARPDVIVRSGNRLIYGTQALWDLLTLVLFTYPGDRLRKCHRPDCKARYFIATHLRQNHCSEVCAQWAQSQYKRDWWAHRGPEWRKGKAKEGQHKEHLAIRRR